MALESANYPSQLNPSWPAGTDSYHQGDDHLRLIKSVLRNTFPNISAPVTVTAEQLNSVGSSMPKGVRVPFYNANAPTGWTRVANTATFLLRIIPSSWTSGGNGSSGGNDPEACNLVTFHQHVTQVGSDSFTTGGPKPDSVSNYWRPRMVDMILCEKS